MATGVTMHERTGWRDESISRRHRLWGVETQATDIDWLVIEYRSESGDIRPVAIVEYKNQHAPEQRLSMPQYVVLGKLATRADLPFFAVRYATDFSFFRVVPANIWAKVLLPENRDMTEVQYVTLLYRLRGYGGVPAKVLEKLKQTAGGHNE